MFAHIMSINFWHTITYIMVIWQVQLITIEALLFTFQTTTYLFLQLIKSKGLPKTHTYIIYWHSHTMNQYKIAIITRVEQLWQVEVVAWPCCKRRLVCDQTCHSPNSPCIKINTHIKGVCSEPISLYSLHWEGTSWWGSYMCIANYT